MTRISIKSKLRAGAAAKPRSQHWQLQDAKARFSELVRRVRDGGPQHVTVHGRDAVVVISAEEYQRLRGSETGRALIDAIQSSPQRDVEIAPDRAVMSVRGVTL